MWQLRTQLWRDQTETQKSQRSDANGSEPDQISKQSNQSDE